MSRCFAFLRALNVGGSHVVKMDHLRQLFESLGFAGVETHIASGNVVFHGSSKSARVLEKRIETGLRKALGYEVATFIRTEAELASIANYSPFPKSKLDRAKTMNIAFVADRPDQKSRQKLMSLRTEIDDFHVHDREIYWLCRKWQSKSTFSNAVLEKILGVQSTIRGVNTIRKMAEKYCSP